MPTLEIRQRFAGYPMRCSCARIKLNESWSPHHCFTVSIDAAVEFGLKSIDFVHEEGLAWGEMNLLMMTFGLANVRYVVFVGPLIVCKQKRTINAGNNNKYKLGAQVTPSNRSPIKTFGQGCNSI